MSKEKENEDEILEEKYSIVIDSNGKIIMKYPQSDNNDIINDEIKNCKIILIILLFIILAKIIMSNVRKRSIEYFINKKAKRFEEYLLKRKEINLRRMKEDYDIMERREKENILLEKEYLLYKFKEEVEYFALKKKLRRKVIDEEELIRKKKFSISLSGGKK